MLISEAGHEMVMDEVLGALYVELPEFDRYRIYDCPGWVYNAAVGKWCTIGAKGRSPFSVHLKWSEGPNGGYDVPTTQSVLRLLWLAFKGELRPRQHVYLPEAWMGVKDIELDLLTLRRNYNPWKNGARIKDI